MRSPLFHLLIILVMVRCVFTKEVSTSEKQPESRSFLRRLGNFYKKSKQGFRNIFFRRKRVAQEADDKEQSTIGEGIDAVMQAIDEFVADGEAAAGDAARSVKEVRDKSDESVEQAVEESEKMVSAAMDMATETAMDTMAKNPARDEDTIKDSATNDWDVRVEFTASDASDERLGFTTSEASDTTEYEVEQSGATFDTVPDTSTDEVISKITEEL